MATGGDPSRDESPEPAPRLRRADRFWVGPVAGLAVLAALAGTYAWVSTRHAPPKPASPALLQVSLDQVSAIRFTAAGKSLTLYAKAGGPLGPLSRTWTMGSPTGRTADTTLVGDFMTSLLTLAPIQTVARHPGAATLSGYGLIKPQTSVALLRGSQPPVILEVGLASPVGSYYATATGNAAVYLISASLVSQISANPNNWLPLPTTPTTPTTPTG